MKTFRPGILAIGLILLGCQASLPQIRPRLPDEGAVYLYLQPLPPEAGRLRAGFTGVSALERDGREIPLSLSLRQLNGRDPRRQRLVAAGALPAGDYSGFVFRVSSAALRGDEGEAALLVPEGPVRLDFPFLVRRREGRVVALALKYAESVEAGFRFSPIFSAFLPDRPSVGLMGFVANRQSNDITVFEKKSFQVFDVIATGTGPSGLALDQRNRKLYVALSGEDSVEIVDLLAGKIADRIHLTPGDEPVALALSPDNRTLLSANRGSNSVSVMDPGARAEVVKIRVGNGPRYIAIDRTGRRAFAFNTLANSISVIDLVGRDVIRTVATDAEPVRGDFNRRGDRLYVIHALMPYLTVIDPETGAIVKRFPIRSGMDAIKVDPNLDLVYLAAPREPAVGVYEPFSFVPVGFLDAPGAVAHMATDAEESTLYLVSPDADRVLVAHRIRRRPVGELDVGNGPSWISVMGEN